MRREDVERLFEMADEGPQPCGLAGITYLSAFFQESTRTRLGFMSAAARQGAIVLDMGAADRLRHEPADDQRMVLAEVADLVAVRHWSAGFAAELALRRRCSVVNAGAGTQSHPSQALIDVYTLMTVLGRDVSTLRILLIGDTGLRSASSFRALADMLGITVSNCDAGEVSSDQARKRGVAALRSADVIYIKPQGGTDYESPCLNAGDVGRPLPPWAVEAIAESSGHIMHALPRGPELPDALMRDARCLVPKQIECGVLVRSAVLRWMANRD